MTERENLISLLKRQGYERAPVFFELCPSLEEEFRKRYGKDKDYRDYFGFTLKEVTVNNAKTFPAEAYYPYLTEHGEDVYIDMWGIGHQRGSAAAMHMTKFVHPLKNAKTVEDILNYPFPSFEIYYCKELVQEIAEIKKQDKVSYAHAECSIWERSWYLRGMEELMMDMLTDEDMAQVLFDIVTDLLIKRVEAFAKADADMIFLGDDIGMQHSIMMSRELYQKWIQPRLKKTIHAAKKIKPDILIWYHSCGYIEPFIPDLIDAGVDILNPVQPECMDFEKIHALYGDRLSFHGTVGTQTTMPFGTPEEVKRITKKNLDIAGEKGGLICSPTHLLEPEVPFENILAYAEACKEYSVK